MGGAGRQGAAAGPRWHPRHRPRCPLQPLQPLVTAATSQLMPSPSRLPVIWASRQVLGDIPRPK